jgi:putative ABC transport system permease protein
MTYAQDRLLAVLLTLFSVAALLLACLGVYGTLSYVVSLRRRDVGLRVALGALRNAIVAHYLAKALKVVGIACIAGLGLSLAFSRMLSSMLYGVSPSDPVTLGTVIGIVVIVAATGAFVPAMRASRIEPVVVLKEE